MSEWRTHAASGNWRSVRSSDIEGLSKEERAELIAALQTVVPRRTRGDGLETFKEPVRPEELKGVDAITASFLLRGLLREENRLLEGGPGLFKPAIDLAIAALQQRLGVQKYKGLLDTYLWCRSDGSFRQICSEYGRAKLDRMRAEAELGHEEQSDRELNYALGPRIWAIPQPERRAMTLAELWHNESFEPNSPEDHALAILDAEFHFFFWLQRAGWQEETHVPERLFSLDPWALAKHAFTIGRRFDALKKKPIELEALKKRKEVDQNRESGSRGGQAQTSKATERKQVLNRLASAKGNLVVKAPSDKEPKTRPQLPDRTDVFFLPDKLAIARAIRLAQTYDRDRDEADKLFWHHGKLLSKKWFEEWWLDFKNKDESCYSNQ